MYGPIRARAVTSFERTVSMPGRIDHQSITADYKDGILHLTLPKAGDEKTKVVKVNVD
ncbi:MAG: Hsp20 family protein [Cyanobacteria bacterium J06621_3]